MDRQYLQAGATSEFFYFKAKIRLIEVLLEKAGENHRAKILDVGAGNGEDLSVISRAGEIYAVEPDPDLFHMIPGRLVVEKLCCELAQVPYGENSFDRVLAFDVLEHFADDHCAVERIFRLLKTGGKFIFTVPAGRSLFGPHDRALNHYRRYNKKMLRDLLKGFRCREMGFWMSILFLPVAVQRRMKRPGPDPEVHFMVLPRAFNRLFYYILLFECRMIKMGIRLPIGTTLYGIFEKG
jgi:SAM-dependent methyltransferase